MPFSGEEPFLRGLFADDDANVLAAFSSNPDMARQGSVSTPEEARAYVDGLISSGGGQRPWAIADPRSGGALIGLVCVSVDSANLNGWFWYWMSDEARGHGWMARAAATVASFELTEGGLQRLELGHRVNNPASGAVARAAGFIKEGTERGKFLIGGQRIDVDTYGRLRTDPFPDTAPLEVRQWR